MSDDRKRTFDAIRRDAEQQSDKALYPYLKVHIFGPFQDHCYAYLTEVKYQLQEFGFENTRVCDDRGNEPPADATQEERWQFWWEESEEFIQNADVGTFLFLDHIFERNSLSDRSLDEARDPSSEGHPKEINSSVVGELFYWLTNEDQENGRTLIIFEEGIYDEIGSLIPGLVNLEDVYYEVIENADVESAVEEARQRCMNWVMDDVREELQARYFEAEGPL